MKISFGQNLTDINRVNKMVIEIQFMSGDADVYHFEDIRFPYDSEMDTINDFERIGAHSSGVTFEQAYALVNQMQTIVNNGNGDSEAEFTAFEQLEHFDALFSDWPGDSTNDFSTPSAYRGYKVKYYNLAGVPYEVIVE